MDSGVCVANLLCGLRLVVATSIASVVAGIAGVGTCGYIKVACATCDSPLATVSGGITRLEDIIGTTYIFEISLTNHVGIGHCNVGINHEIIVSNLDSGVALTGDNQLLVGVVLVRVI